MSPISLGQDRYYSAVASKQAPKRGRGVEARTQTRAKRQKWWVNTLATPSSMRLAMPPPSVASTSYSQTPAETRRVQKASTTSSPTPSYISLYPKNTYSARHHSRKKQQHTQQPTQTSSQEAHTTHNPLDERSSSTPRKLAHTKSPQPGLEQQVCHTQENGLESKRHQTEDYKRW